MPTPLTANPAVPTATAPPVPPSPDPITPEAIMLAVAPRYNVNIKDLKGPLRTRRFSQPRQLAMFLCRLLCKDVYGRPLSYPQIGLAFDGKDHTTVMSSCRTLAREYRDSTTLRELCAQIAQGLGSVIPPEDQWQATGLLPPSKPAAPSQKNG